MRLLIDTNVLLDMIFSRTGCENSIRLFKKIEKEGSAAYITASAVTDLFYIIRKETHNTEKTYEVLENVLKLTQILSVTGNDIRDAFDEKWKDFEDCLQFTVAKNTKMDCLITNNIKDYINSSLPILSPYEYIKKNE